MPTSDRATILVVDDEPANRALVRTRLVDGYNVIEAACGAEALDILSRTPVDLVLLDVMMPGMSGIEVCRLIKRTTEHGAFQPVILLTALGDQQDRNQGLQAGADDFLTKPVDRQELLMRVKTFVKLRQQDVQLRHQVRELSERDLLIRHQLGELQALDSLKDDLVSLMVHDLRNPLTGIVGFLDVLERSLAEGELREEALMALDASERLRKILDDLLRLRLLESGVECLHREPVAADGLVRDAIRSVCGSAKALQVEIAQVIEPPQVNLAVDRKLLRRAIENLLTNALKYSPRGALVEAGVRRKNGDIEIEIADRGAGIPDELKSRLFEKFGSLEVVRGQQRRGVGLGLYFVRMVANAHGGRALVRDREGGGTSFALLLPRGAMPASF